MSAPYGGYSLELRELKRRFGATVALDGLSFGVPPGQVFGFLGPNGAGKTTAMRAIFGVVGLDGGEITWQGKPVGDAQRRGFGYMPEERGLYAGMRIADQVEYFGRLHGMSAASARERAAYWLTRLGLAGREQAKLESLSHGNQQRVQLAASLVHDPELLVLDEPFAGLDPGGVDDMSAVLAERARAGATVVFSSHQLDLVEHLCERVAIIHRGRVVADGAVADLERGPVPHLAVKVADDAEGTWAAGLGIGATGVENGTVRFTLADREESQRILDTARKAGTVEYFGWQVRRLSEVFREVTGSSLQEAGG